MYAVIRTGGKQVRVEPGEHVRVEKLAGDPGSEIQLGEVLLVGDGESVTVGTPLVDGASVRGTITAQARHPKLRVFKMKRRKGYRRMQGHRQDYTEVRVESIDH